MELGHVTGGFGDPRVDLGLEGKVGANSGPQVLELVNCVEFMRADVDAQRRVSALARHLSLLQADTETKLMTCVCKLVSQSLESFFCVCAQGGIVCKEGLFNGDGPDLGLGSESCKVEQFAVRSCVQVDSVFIVVEGAGQEHGEEDPKEGGSDHTILLDSAVDGEWLRCAPL